MTELRGSMIARPGVQARRCHVVVEMHEHVTSSVHLSQAPTPVTLPKCSPSMAFRSTFRQAYGPKGSRNRPAATPRCFPVIGWAARALVPGTDKRVFARSRE